MGLMGLMVDLVASWKKPRRKLLRTWWKIREKFEKTGKPKH
jgi:hypothetical protein